jgi:signal transduction histidine kinase
VLGGFASLSFTDPPSDPAWQFFATFIAVFSVGAHTPARTALAALIFTLAYVGLGAWSDGNSAADVGYISFLFGGCWLLGRVLWSGARRTRALERHAVRLEVDREAAARAAVAVERARIARELHDVIAHGVSVMVLQTAGVRRLLHDDQARERDVLHDVEDAGRQALGELRRLLGMLREHAGEAAGLEPQPSLARIEELAGAMRSAGLEVDLRVEGDPAGLSAGLDLSAYRIVQEALTNVVKHAAPARASVRVHVGGRWVELEVVDDGADAVSPPIEGAGHGLVGMRERVGLYGGELEAGPQAGGGFRVWARLPVESA